jgi:molecular chaperone DnaK
MFIGKRAYDQDAFSPESVAKRFKRLMGTNSPITFKGADRTMTPEQASSEILKALLVQAEIAVGDLSVEGAVITIPAAFNQMQSEATMRAGHDAGMKEFGLLQEPIAAAMASLADRQRRNQALRDGQFLVYDLGGGTFDAAIVQSVGGTVNIVGHSGVNMLGGTDFDRTIVNTIVRPWLLEHFDLPQDFQKNPSYQRVLRIAAFFVEKAKIELSTQPTSTIFADENQIRARDSGQREIYLDIPLNRSQVEMLIVDEIDRTVDVCRKLLTESGYEPSDIDRIVFIGGPTRMPIVRDRVPSQLGISGDLDSDPMTAVAVGAAIYAESREWGKGGSVAKSARATARTTGPVNIEYGFPSRTADSRIRIRLKPSSDIIGRGYALQVDSDMGWSSGQVPLDTTRALNDVPVARRGDNQFRAMVFDALGLPIKQAETRFTVKRTEAAAGGTPLTHTIGVKVVEALAGIESNTLAVLVEKGHPLPATGATDFRSARDLKTSDGGFLAFEVYQIDDANVTDPTLNLHVGAFQISSTDLEPGEVIRRGDRIKVFWSLDENGLLNCALEIEKISRRFDTGKMFTVQGALKNFEGQDGEELASAVLDTAESDLHELEKTLGLRVASECFDLKQRIENRRQQLKDAYEADCRRSVADEGRAIRQEISKIKSKRENVGDVLRTEIDSVASAYNGVIRPTATPAICDRFDRLVRQAGDAILQGNIADAKKSLFEMQATLFEEARKQPSFVIDTFLDLAKDRHFAIDKVLHDRLVEDGKARIGKQDIDGLRSLIGKMLDNRYPTTASGSAAMTLAGLMKW